MNSTDLERDGSNDPELVREWEAELVQLTRRISRLRNTVRNAQAKGGRWQGQSVAYWQEELRHEVIARNIWTCTRKATS